MMNKVLSNTFRRTRHLFTTGLCPQISTRSFVSATPTLPEKQAIKVPTMGDSITEGTVIEWMVKPGQAFQVDDVVALVETDKVTVEIKAEVDGVLTQHFCNVDETIAVGAPLYEIDTEAVATVQATSGSEQPTATTAQATAPHTSGKTNSTDTIQSTDNSKPESAHRTPLIKFLGKEGWARKLSSAPSLPVEQFVIPPMFGRPAFTEDEMEALILGGASLAIPGYSSVFK